MASAQQVHVLVVAHRTAATPGLLEAVRKRAEEGPSRFTLLVPNQIDGLGPGARQQEWKRTQGEHVLALALPLLEEAAGGPVDGLVSAAPIPFDAIEETLRDGDFDEIIISTLPHPVSHWLHIDLPTSVAHFGLPVTTVVARHEARVAAV